MFGTTKGRLNGKGDVHSCTGWDAVVFFKKTVKSYETAVILIIL
jgi:hypothetical protein